MAEPPSTHDVQQRARARWVVVVVCLALSIPTTAVQLFGRSAWASDYSVHLAVVDHLQHGHLEVAHFVFHGAVAILGSLVTNPIATVLVIALAQVLVGLLVFRVLCEAFGTGARSGARAAGLALAATAGLLLSGAINLVTFPRLYLGYLPTTTYHSPTVQVLKPLALLLFLWLHDQVLAGTAAPRTSWGLGKLAILSIATTMAKPSFSIVVVPAFVATVLVYRRTIPVRRTLAILAVLCSAVAAVVVWQAVFLYAGGGDDSGVGVRPLAVALTFAGSARLLVIKLVLSVAFPAIAAILNPRAALADRRLVFSYVCFAVSLLYYLLLAELGPKIYHGNFMWGAMVSLFLVFVSTAAMLARQAAAAPRAAAVAWLILLVHVVCGVVWLAAASGMLGHHCDDGYGNWCW